MEWWLWLAGGLALIVAELVTPSGFFIIFFGMLSVASLLVFRGKLKTTFQPPPPPDIDSFVGVLAVVQESLQPGLVGRVEVRGSSWSARNTSDVTLAPGQRARVAGIDGLLLTVVPE
jgi:membrane protein implicated in regulation of membrane protease activity